MTYPVVLLVEQPLTTLDAEQILSLHSGVDGGANYIVLLPVEDAAGRVEAAMGALGSGELVAPMALDAQEFDELQHELMEQARADLASSLATMRAAGGVAEGQVVTADPVNALVEAVGAAGAAEAIVLT
ncbi:MAG TPA: hypothetical protein PKK40_07705, partial [Marmoricola sp.]|nr:hypothetical protein [Marmoricola sp.]